MTEYYICVSSTWLINLEHAHRILASCYIWFLTASISKHGYLRKSTLFHLFQKQFIRPEHFQIWSHSSYSHSYFHDDGSRYGRAPWTPMFVCANVILARNRPISPCISIMAAELIFLHRISWFTKSLIKNSLQFLLCSLMMFSSTIN